MTVVQPNSIAGINSITVQSGNSLSIHKSDGTLIREIVAATGVSTFSSVSVGSATTTNNAGKSINIGLGASIAQHTDNSLTFGTNGDPRATIDASGNLVHGGGSSRSAVGGAQLVQVEGLTASAGFSAVRNSNDAHGPYISLAKSRGTALGAVTVIQANDDLGALRFGGGDGTDIASEGARIEATVDGTPGSNDIPTRLTFQTTADGAAAPTERLRITSGGNIGINASAASNRVEIIQDPQGFPLDSAQPSATVLIKHGTSGSNRRWVGIGASLTGAWIQSSSPGGTGLAAPLWINKGGGEVTLGNDRVKVEAAGDVGIGTDNPSCILDVLDNSASGYIAEFRQVHADNPATILIDSPADGNIRPTAIELSQGGTIKWGIGQVYASTSSQGFHITSGAATQANSKLVISTAGLVGFNTDNPLTVAHFDGKATGGPLTLARHTDTSSHLNFRTGNSGGTLRGSIGANSGAILALYNGSSTERIRFGTSGEIGVGGAGSISFGTAGKFLRSGGNSAGCTWADPGGGIDEADIWRLTTSFIGNASGGYIGSNWERADSDGQNHKGTGMSESSGTFTFPSTGYWFVQYTVNMTTQYTPSQPHSHRNTGTIKTCIDGSSYDNASASSSGIYNFGSSSYPSHGTATCSMIFDVTSTSNCKCRFDWGAGQGSETCIGDTSYNATYVTFIRLADT